VTVALRPATADDAAEMASLINEIIAIGGTTAYEDAFDRQAMHDAYVSPPNLICCTIAEENGVILGFQGLFHPDSDDPATDGWAYIATFVRVGRNGGGVGRALFAETAQRARAMGVKTIDATIRADNAGGLRFYSSLGFRDYGRLTAMPLKNGIPVDRIRKRFDF
jgi:L-amino acid N-acyltransferase YncA